MTKKRIIVFGSEGMLGCYVTKHFQRQGYEVIDLNSVEYDVIHDGADRLCELLDAYAKNSVIINCIGLIPHRKPDKERLIAVNAQFPHFLARYAEYYTAIGKNTKLIHITTDCVYQGDKEFNYESTPHDAISDYGKSKSLGEPENAVVIRTSIIGEEKKNKLSLLEWAKSQKGNDIDGYLDHLWNGVTCLQLAKYIQSRIEADDLEHGLRHYFTTFSYDDEIVPALYNKFRLLDIINCVYDLDLKIHSRRAGYVSRALSSNNIQHITPSLEEQIKELKDFNIYD